MEIYKNLAQNIEFLKNKLSSDDVTFLEVKAGLSPAVIIFINDSVDKVSMGELVMRPLTKLENKPNEKTLYDCFLFPEVTLSSDLNNLADQIVSGTTVFICDGVEKAFCFALRKFETRAVSEPPTATVIKGPREGFVESLPINISLIRRKLQTPELKFEMLKTGKFSKTNVALCYVNGIVDKKLVKKVKERINAIEIDAVLDSSYISKFIGEHKSSFFKQTGNTEKPDILCARILEGRVGILVDGSPIVLTVPYLLVEDFQSPGDYYNSPLSATLSRIIRFFSVLLSVLLPTLYVSAQLFHLQLIPLPFLLTIVNSIKGIPLSPSHEMFFSLLIFKILNETSIRMPKYVGMVVSILGGLVLGETAVNAGIISAPTLMITALAGICLYTVPELEKNFSLMRLGLLVIGGSFGGYGVLVALALILIYLVTFESYSTPLCAPFSPLIKEDLKDGIYKGFLREMKYRPRSLSNKNVSRIGNMNGNQTNTSIASGGASENEETNKQEKIDEMQTTIKNENVEIENFGGGNND